MAQGGQYHCRSTPGTRFSVGTDESSPNGMLLPFKLATESSANDRLIPAARTASEAAAIVRSFAIETF
jgi:hypothetical protein